MLADADLEVVAIEADFARHIDKTAEDSWRQVMFKAREVLSQTPIEEAG